jgi:hypothetical protein
VYPANSAWVLATIGTAGWIGLTATAFTVALLLVLQLGDLHLFTLPAAARRVVWGAAAVACVGLAALVILRFVVIH